jgi:hypothetical protein
MLVRGEAWPETGGSNPVHFGSFADIGRCRLPAQPSSDAPVTTPPFDDCPPQAQRVTSYDKRHFVTYLRLLEAAKCQADWREVALILFGIDAAAEPERARAVHDSYLARARWMTEAGYRDLLEKGP